MRRFWRRRNRERPRREFRSITNSDAIISTGVTASIDWNSSGTSSRTITFDNVSLVKTETPKERVNNYFKGEK